MTTNRRRELRRICACFVVTAGVVASVAVLSAADPPATPARLTPAGPSELTTLGFKFDGSPSCSSEKCHGAEKATERPDFWGNEYTLWHGRKDPHHTAYRMLLNAQSKQIAAKLNIPQPNKSARCTNCHTTEATGPGGHELQGKEYSAAEGVSCDSCHGPSQKWLEPHAQVGWIKDQRAKLSHDDLLKTWGLFDTRPVVTRAERCVGCHLSTPADLVAAGHPEPVFEMNHFSNIYPDRHWRDDAPAQLWATGQVAELRETMLRLAQLASAQPPTDANQLQRAYDRALAHERVLSLVLQNNAPLDPATAAISDAMAKHDLSALASAAQEIASRSGALLRSAATFKSDASSARTALSRVAADASLSALGPEGREQQAYAIEAFAQAAGDSPILAAVQPMLPKKPGQPVPADQFAKALQDVRSKIR